MGPIPGIRRVLVCALTAALLSGIASAAAGATGLPYAAPVLVQRSGWRWSDPTPQGESLNALAFGSAGEGYAVGDHGTVLFTPSAGLEWFAVPSGTEASLTQVQVVEPGGVVIGGGCVLREKTASTGFHRLPVNESEQSCATKIASFSFLNGSTGFVEQADGSILFTSDGGASFQPKTAVPLGGGTPVELRFVSPSTGFALVDAGGRGLILRTTDGAGSWTQVGSAPAGEPLDDIAAVSPTLLYAVGGGIPRTGASGSVMMVSEDGGGSWKERVLGSPAGSTGPQVKTVSCADATHCVFTVRAPGPENALLRTEDGGITMLQVTPSERALAAAGFASPGSVLAVGAGGATAVSHDAGATFLTRGAGETGILPQLFAKLAGEYQGPVVAGAGSSAYRAGKAGRIAVTLNGGQSWGALQLPTSAPIVDVSFPTVQIGYAINEAGTAYRTANGGQSWAILGSEGEPPSSMLATSTGTVVLFGPTGMRRSTDAGASFAPVGGSVLLGRRHHRAVRRALSSFPLFAGSQMVGSAMIAWGDEAIESTDGGAHWTLIPRPLKLRGIEALSFVTPSAGYVVSGQRLFATRDRGRTWTEISSLGTEALGGDASISFSSLADGYVTGAFGGSRDVVLRTDNGGRSWVPEQLPRQIETVTAAQGVDYAVGADALFETTTGGHEGEASTVRLSLVRGHRISRAKLRRARGRIALHGSISNPSPGEAVIVSYRTRGRAVWRHRRTLVNGAGAFSLTVGGISASTEFVAQWGGEGPAAGAGSVAQLLLVTKR